MKGNSVPPRKKFTHDRITPVMREDNPNRFDNLSPEKRRELQSKGGKASVAKRRARRKMREDLELLLDSALKGGKLDEFDFSKHSLEDAMKMNLTVQEKLLIAAINKGLTGNVNAMEFLRDSIGEKPVEKQETMDVTPVIISGESELKD